MGVRGSVVLVEVSAFEDGRARRDPVSYCESLTALSVRSAVASISFSVIVSGE